MTKKIHHFEWDAAMLLASAAGALTAWAVALLQIGPALAGPAVRTLVGF
jgi:hypothetical protein